MKKTIYLIPLLLIIIFSNRIKTIANAQETNAVFRIEAIMIEGTTNQHKRVLDEFVTNGLHSVYKLSKDERGTSVCFPVIEVSENASQSVSNFYAYVQYATEFINGKPVEESFRERGIGEFISVSVNSVDRNMVGFDISLDHARPPAWREYPIDNNVICQPEFQCFNITAYNVILYNNGVIQFGVITNLTGESYQFCARLSKRE